MVCGMLAVAQPEPVICLISPWNGGLMQDLLERPEATSFGAGKQPSLAGFLKTPLVPEIFLQLQSFTPVVKAAKVVNCRLLRILNVDDDEELAGLLSELQTREGFRVDMQHDGVRRTGSVTLGKATLP